MAYSRKHLFPFILLALSFFPAVVVAGSFHHHDPAENSHSCSLCNWQQTAAQTPSAPAPPLAAPFLLFVFLFTFTPTFISTFKSFPSLGRAPPQKLL